MNYDLFLGNLGNTRMNGIIFKHLKGHKLCQNITYNNHAPTLPLEELFKLRRLLPLEIPAPVNCEDEIGVNEI